VLHADPPVVLGLAAGALSFDEVAALVDIDGDEAALRTFFDAPKHGAAEPAG